MEAMRKQQAAFAMHAGLDLSDDDEEGDEAGDEGGASQVCDLLVLEPCLLWCASLNGPWIPRYGLCGLGAISGEVL